MHPVPPFSDPQCAPVIAECAFCGAALYETDEFYAISGRVICEDCLPVFAREEFRSFRLTGREWRSL